MNVKKQVSPIREVLRAIIKARVLIGFSILPFVGALGTWAQFESGNVLMGVFMLVLTLAAAGLVVLGVLSFLYPPLFELEVMIAGNPAEHLKISLVSADDRQGEVILTGISDIRGRANMKVLTKDVSHLQKPKEFVVVCEALTGGKVQEPWSSQSESPLTLIWNGEKNLIAELPADAIQS